MSEVDPERPASVSTGGFLRVASRTGRARWPGIRLSTSPVGWDVSVTHRSAKDWGSLSPGMSSVGCLPLPG